MAGFRFAPPPIVYIHGKGGCADEALHYQALFPTREVWGLEYSAAMPWEAAAEFPAAFDALTKGRPALLIANSIGAYFAMNAPAQAKLEKAYFISPIVDMERLIQDMMRWAHVTESDLRAAQTLPTDFGETLSWDYLCYVRRHPLDWHTPTSILYGSADNLTAPDAISAFARTHQADLTVLENGEHWFHTPEQMAFLDHWLLQGEG